MTKGNKILLGVVGLSLVVTLIVRNRKKEIEKKSNINGDMIVRYNTHLLGAEVFPHPNWMKF